MCVGSTSSALTAPFGFPVRNGSIRTRVSPSVSSKAACPRKRMSIRSSLVVVCLEFACQLIADSDADHHAEACLLGHQGPHCRYPFLRVVSQRRDLQRVFVRVLEPAALLERDRQQLLQLWGGAFDQCGGGGEALGIAERLDRGVELGVREGPLGHRRIIGRLRLTSLSHGAGCACKLPASELHALLA